MKSKITFLFIIISSFNLIAQKRVANKFYDCYAYDKAAELYKVALKRGDSSQYILTRLGDCYFNKSNITQAAYWYNLAAQKNDKLSNETALKYVQSLRSLGKLQEADSLLSKLNMPSVTKAFEASKVIKNNDSILFYNLDLNTKHSDFGAYQFKNTLYFSSAKNKNGKIYPWNNQPYLDVFQTKVIPTEQGFTSESIEPVSSKTVNTNFHESNLAITKDGKTMYFTRNNLRKNEKLDYDKGGTSNLRIFRVTQSNGLWSKIEDLPFNDEMYSNGHPALSPDEKFLYFTSDRPGGFGGSDIYKVAINDDGSFGEPENLGEHINTSGREMFPFMTEDYTLFFSSDNYKNFGLLDIFKTELFKNNNKQVINLGKPFNSKDDDFAFTMNANSNKGYFSSNRSGGKGDDDIYFFETYICEQVVEGVTYNAKTKEILPNTMVTLLNKSGVVIDSILSNNQGFYTFKKLDCNSSYVLRATKQDFKGTNDTFKTTTNHKGKTKKDLYLTPLIKDTEIVLNPIHFDFDKWDIRPDAAFELENIVDVLRANPTMIIKIEGHTDSRGADDYNEILSDRRAKSVRDYLFSRAIEKHRIISAIGYGEKQLVNKCTNNVKCTEDEHQENRRSKFIIVSQ